MRFTSLSELPLRAVRFSLLAILALALFGVLAERDIRGTGSPPRSPETTLTELASRGGGRVRDPLAVAAAAPRSRIVLDETCDAWTELRYSALADPATVNRAKLSQAPEISVVPNQGEASWGNHEWRLWLAGGSETSSRTLLVWCSGGEQAESFQNSFDIVDLNLLRDSSLEATVHTSLAEGSASPPVQSSRSPALDTLVDFAVLAFFMLLGASFVSGSAGAIAGPIALLTGIGLWSGVALTLFPIPAVSLISAAISVLAAFLRGRSEATCVGLRRNRASIVSFAALVGVVVHLTRTSGWYLIHPTDSMFYLLGGWAYASGDLSPEFVFGKRGMVQQAVHAPVFAFGGDAGLQSFTPVMLVTGIWLAVTLALKVTGSRLNGRVSAILLAVILLVALSPHIVRNAALYNSHIPVGVLLLGIGGLWAANRRSLRDAQGAAWAAGAMGSAIVLLRPEGIILVALMLAGTVDRAGANPWRIAWRLVGLTSVLWSGLLFVGASARGQEAGSEALLALVLGMLSVLAPWIYQVARLDGRHLARLMLGILWAAVGLLALSRFESISFFTAARANVLESRGGWGLIGVLLAVLVVAALAVRGRPETESALRPIRTLLIGFVPITMLSKMADNVQTLDLGRLLSGGGRVGFFDSVNRMWLHIIFAALFLVLVRLLDDWHVTETGEQGRFSVLASLARRIAAAVVIAVLVGSWNPVWVDVRTAQLGWDEVSIGSAEIEGRVPGPALTDGVAVSQTLWVDVSRQGEAEGAADIVCVDVPFVTYGRTNAGEILVDIVVSGQSERFAFPAASLQDWQAQRACVKVETPLSAGRWPIGVLVAGRGAEAPDAAVSPLFGDLQDVAVAFSAMMSTPGSVERQQLGEALAVQGSVHSVTSAPIERSAPLVQRFLEWVLPLGVPTVVGVLVILLLALGIPWAGSGGRRGRDVGDEQHGAVLDGSPSTAQALGVGLTVGGLLLLAVGMGPASDDRDLTTLRLPRYGAASAQLDIVAGPVEQILPVSDMPEADEVGRDALGRRERLCLAVPAFVRDGRAEGGRIAGSIEMAVALGPAELSGARESSEVELVSEPVLLSAIEGERLVGCFAVTPEELRSAGEVRLTLRADGVPDGLAVEVGARKLRDGEPPARGLGHEGTVVSSRALDVAWLRETPSYRERLFAGIGYGTLAAGVVLLGSTTIAGRLRRRRGGLLPVAGVR